MLSQESPKKVWVGLSGGVDSAVAAALLKEHGYDVTGVFLQVWQPDFLACSRGDDRREAMRVAAHLGIPFKVIDAEDAYKSAVVDYMIAEYKAGRTPNPDSMCNKHIKFDLFLKAALKAGVEYIATGHYARINQQPTTNNSQHMTNDDGVDTSQYQLLAGVDTNKDQSYFLWTLTSEKLAHVLFPLGVLEKPRVRELARSFGLPNAQRQESQGVCFMGQFSMADFLAHYIPKKRGDLLDSTGEVIGYHDGAFFYTHGQRHGFTLTHKTPHDAPHYVVATSVADNTVTVAPREGQEAYHRTRVALDEVSFVAGELPDTNKDYSARIRYRQNLQTCRLKTEGERVVIVFEHPQRAVTAGQSLVLYDGDVCLGGGTIV